MRSQAIAIAVVRSGADRAPRRGADLRAVPALPVPADRISDLQIDAIGDRMRAFIEPAEGAPAAQPPTDPVF
jgi:hypothetical protein